MTWAGQPGDGGSGDRRPDSEPGGLTADPELVQRARQGDLSAFDDLVRQHAAQAYHAAFIVLDDHHDAQETVQNAFLAAWRGLDGFRGDSEFGTWLHSIVTRLALNLATRRRGTVSLDQEALIASAASGPTETAERTAAAVSITAAMQALPDAQRSAITLRHRTTCPMPGSPP